MTTPNLNVALDTETERWLKQLAIATNRSIESLVSEILSWLAAPDAEQDTMIDRLLTHATQYFPPVMTLEEHTEMREEVLDYLYLRLQEVSESMNVNFSAEELQHMRALLAKRSEVVWSGSN